MPFKILTIASIIFNIIKTKEIIFPKFLVRAAKLKANL